MYKCLDSSSSSLGGSSLSNDSSRSTLSKSSLLSLLSKSSLLSLLSESALLSESSLLSLLSEASLLSESSLLSKSLLSLLSLTLIQSDASSSLLRENDLENTIGQSSVDLGGVSSVGKVESSGDLSSSKGSLVDKEVEISSRRLRGDH